MTRNCRVNKQTSNKKAELYQCASGYICVMIIVIIIDYMNSDEYTAHLVHFSSHLETEHDNRN